MKQGRHGNWIQDGDPYMYGIYSPKDIPEERREEIIGRIAQEIVDRGMVAPAIFFLELIKPLSFIGSQVMVMANPIVQLIFTSKLYWEFTVLMEDRENVEFLIKEIERRNDEKRRNKKDTRN